MEKSPLTRYNDIGYASAMAVVFIVVALLLTSTNAKTFTVGLAGFLSAYNLDLGPMCAGAFLFSFPVMIISLAVQKYIVQGMTAGAVKG